MPRLNTNCCYVICMHEYLLTHLLISILCCCCRVILYVFCSVAYVRHASSENELLLSIYQYHTCSLLTILLTTITLLLILLLLLSRAVVCT